jgi:hypothetical protein
MNHHRGVSARAPTRQVHQTGCRGVALQRRTSGPGAHLQARADAFLRVPQMGLPFSQGSCTSGASVCRESRGGTRERAGCLERGGPLSNANDPPYHYISIMITHHNLSRGLLSASGCVTASTRTYVRAKRLCPEPVGTLSGADPPLNIA